MLYYWAHLIDFRRSILGNLYFMSPKHTLKLYTNLLVIKELPMSNNMPPVIFLYTSDSVGCVWFWIMPIRKIMTTIMRLVHFFLSAQLVSVELWDFTAFHTLPLNTCLSLFCSGSIFLCLLSIFLSFTYSSAKAGHEHETASLVCSQTFFPSLYVVITDQQRY